MATWYLAEYKSLRSAVEQRVRLEHQVLSYQALFVGAVVTGLVTFETHGIAQTPLPVLGIAWLVTPISIMFGSLALRHIADVIEIVHYMNLFLRERMIETAGGRPVMGWDIYLASDHKVVRGRILLPLLAARILLFVAPSGLATLFFWWAGQAPLGTAMADALALVDVVAILYLLVAYAQVGRLWARSIDSYTREMPPSDSRRDGRPIKPIL